MTAIVLLGAGCWPPAPGPGTQARVATFNTQCIVPEMDDINLLTQIVNALEKGSVACDGTLAEIAGDIFSLGGLTDGRGESRDRTRERAMAIAQLIKAQKDHFDIIALNEVFLEDAREIFIDELSPIFPYYVAKLEGSTICEEDSGLMLFSRWPLETIGPVNSPNGGPVLPFDHAYVEYDACRCEDCLAEKGAGYVRILNPNTNEVYHVMFTHLQADSEFCPLDELGATPPASFSSVRNAQLGQINDLINSWVGESVTWPGMTHIIVMGDMNVVGTQKEAASAAGLAVPDNNEWQEKFDPAQVGGYFAGNLLNPNASSPLYDAWAQTTSPWDPGVTHGSNTRYDYIFLNCFPAGPVQPPYQRLTVPHHMTILPFEDESDHYGVHAVLNRWQAHCMPIEALAPQQGYDLPGGNPNPQPNQPTLGPWPNNQSYSMNITVAGGYQWFRFDLPGTYSFSLVDNTSGKQNEDGGFEMRVYTAVDLTYDIWNYYGEETDISDYFPPSPSILGFESQPIIAKKFLIPDAPFYISISPKDPAGTGAYTLYAHRHEGKTKKDAILLPVSCTQEYFQGTTALNSEDMPWFQINLERPDNPASHQSLRFVVFWQPQNLNGTWLLRLQDENDNIIEQSSTIQTSSPDVNDDDPAYGESTPYQYVEVLHSSLEDLSGAPNPRFYLRVARPGLIINNTLTSPYDRYRLRWETNLTILHGKQGAGTQSLRLQCNDETCIDAGNSDETGLQMWADDLLIYDWNENNIGGSATDMDSGDGASLEKFIRPDGSLLRYVDHFQFRVLEFDPGGPDYGEKRTIGPLKSRQNKGWKESSKVSVPCSGVGSDGEYELFFNRSRSLQYRPCD